MGRLGQAVGVEEQDLARAEAEAVARVGGRREEAQRQARSLDGPHSPLVRQQRARVPGVGELQRSVRPQAGGDQGGVARARGRLREEAVCPLHDRSHGQILVDQRPEQRVEVGLEEGGRDPFAGHVSEDQVEGLGVP